MDYKLWINDDLLGATDPQFLIHSTNKIINTTDFASGIKTKKPSASTPANPPLLVRITFSPILATVDALYDESL